MTVNEALADLDRAIALTPEAAELHLKRGMLLNELGRWNDARQSLDRALALNPTSPDAYNSRGLAGVRLNDSARALADFTQAIALAPDHPKAYSNRAGVLLSLARYEEALADADVAIKLAPASAAAHNNRAGALNELKRFDDALASVDQALTLNPKLADAHRNRGVILMAMRRYDESIASCERAIAIFPRYIEAYECLGAALNHARRYEDSLRATAKTLEIDPTLKFARGTALYLAMHCCDWSTSESRVHDVLARLEAGELASNPYPLLAIPSSPHQQKLAAVSFSRDQLPASDGYVWKKQPRQGRRLRLGYFSDHFHNHATSFLIAGLLEQHDRAQFEIFGFSFARGGADPMRQRLAATFDGLIDVHDKRDTDVAKMARELDIDIAIDLMGFNAGRRTAIFAHRAAPVQVNYLGYPGTVCESLDYIIADPVVVTPQSEAHFAEKVVYLPHSYQPNDSKRRISDRVFTRRELGLPDSGIVFCCFNSNYKLTPDVFDVWMRLLQRVEGSVLWLLAGSKTAVVNLRKEAAKRGVAPERLVFAERMDLPDHLARHRAADLVLDTFYYGAHTTASDALWAGVPVLTKAGEAFASRVGASLLTAIGLSELITHSVADYEALAIALATQPERLAALKQRLAANRLTYPLFDTARYARYIETAYLQMWSLYQAGAAPDHIRVPA